ncbi:MAG: UDP-glucose dehydrogenase family protein [Actinomycetes bacterium]
MIATAATRRPPTPEVAEDPLVRRDLRNSPLNAEGENKALRISVLGTGYLGATHAAGLAELGHEVVGVDVNEEKIAALSAGRVPFHEPALEALLSRHVLSGRLRFTTDIASVGDWADVHFVCVGTPQRSGSYAADLTALDAAIDSLASIITRSTLIVGKSTVPVGTAQRTIERLRRLVPPEIDIGVAWNPELLREGHAVADTLRPDRLVFGVTNERDEDILRHVYSPLLDSGVPAVVTDLPTAELVKVAANSFLATKISFANAMAEICEVTGADVTELARALSFDDRIGGRCLQAGLGFGGGCLSKDIRGFMARAEELGVDSALAFLRQVDEINMRRRSRMIDLTREVLGGSVLGHRVAVLGAAFKPDTDDVRDSPALNVAAGLQLIGAQVKVYDPEAMTAAKSLFPTLTYASSTDDAVLDAEVVVLLTEWREFLDLDPAELGELVSARRIVDGRNALTAASWRAAGWTYRALGRP